MRNTPTLLLWTDATGPYIDAIHGAGLADRVKIETLGRKDKPSEAQLATTTVLLAPGVPAGLLPRMPNLLWAQAMTAGVESWMALPRPTVRTDPDLRPRHPSGIDAGEHPRRIVPRHQALCRGRRGPKAKPLGPAHRRPVERQNTRNPRFGRDRTRGCATRYRARHARDRHQTAPRAHAGSGRGVAGDRTNEVLAQSDFVLLLLPATPETNNFIDAERLAQMKPTAWLLNFGRGHLIKDDDLISAVTHKKIAGAVLDVFRQEPLPKEHRFWTTPGMLVLPHIGGPHPDRDSIVARLFVENLRRFLNGEPLKEVVDRAAGY